MYHHLVKGDKGWPFVFERTQIILRNVVFETLRSHIDFPRVPLSFQIGSKENR